jgi:hypothetical protein
MLLNEVSPTTITGPTARPLTFYDLSAEHWRHLSEIRMTERAFIVEEMADRKLAAASQSPAPDGRRAITSGRG